MTTTLDFTSIARIGRQYGHKNIPDEEFVVHLSYDGRESYLEWVIAWKAGYRALTIEIRRLKAGDTTVNNILPRECVFNRNYAKAFARAMLALRAVGKRDSWARAKVARMEREAAAV